MTTRTDIHRPSQINPADYDWVAFEYLDTRDLGNVQFLIAERARIRAHMERTGGKYSAHKHGGNCHICGSVNAIYTALFHHRASNVYVRTGLDCAEKLDCRGVEAFRKNVKSALEANAGKRKAAAVLEKAGLSKAWDVYVGPEGRDITFDQQSQGYKGGLRYEDSTIVDIVGKLVKYGSISDAQLNFVGRLLAKIENRAAIQQARAAESEAAKPLPVTGERVTIRGTVLSVKIEDCDGFFSRRMLVQHADGWKVFGTLPAALESVERGAMVEFAAVIKPSNNDPKFGFFSRPTKARTVAPPSLIKSDEHE